MTKPVTIGLDVWQFKCSIQELRETWRLADVDGGFDNIWVCDHFLPLVPHEDYQVDIFEAWSLVAAMAEATERIRIGVMVSGNTYRHPSILAKIGATVDHLSTGRLEFGLGAAGTANAPDEHAMLGLDFPSTPDRIRRLGEACTVIKKLWTEEIADFEGKYYRLTGAIAKPKPLQKPYPPFWIGGDGEKLTLRVVAEQADVWNAIGRNPTGLPGGGIPELQHKLDVLDQHCADIGRDPKTIKRSVQVHLDRIEDLEATIRRIEDLIAVGFSDVILLVPPPNPIPRVELALEKLLPHFRSPDMARPVTARGTDTLASN
jgi:F420-dependent oxidoreductase-like protein